MPIVVSEGASYEPHPAGDWPAVCVDVVDHGMVETAYEGHVKHVRKVSVWYYAGDTREDGTPNFAQRRFTASLHKQANLRAYLEAWRGRAFSAQELAGFDLESLIGAPAYIQIQHVERNGKTYANITNCMRLPQGMGKVHIPADYVRQKDRQEQLGQVDGYQGSDSPPVDDYF